MASSVSLGAVGALAATHHGAITRRLAAELGLTKHGVAALIRNGILGEPAPGLLVINGSPATFSRTAHAASLLLGERGAIADVAAGYIHRCDGVEVPATIGLVVAKGTRVRTGILPIGVRSTRAGLDRRDLVAIDGLPVTGLARTICDLASFPTAPPLERLIDDFERRGHSLAWLGQTATRLQAQGRSGPGAVLDEVAQRHRSRSAEGQVRGSWFQKLVAECLASPLLPGLVEEYEIRDAAGRFVARCDLAIPKIRLGIEAHSRRHHFGDRAEAFDEQRDNRAAECGWLLRYVTWADLHRDPGAVRAYFERLAALRAAELSLTL